MKTRKSIAKRIKVTSTGKYLRRTSRINHFNAKKRSRTQQRGKVSRPIGVVHERYIRQAIAARA
ncbi:MAG: 50S ribosomal protein L35 [Candidatus Sungbacteria bacterium]|uniref:50S ribosomal protein L35 n=1 Tax=Candidatus Sungiibacteriota bacterium TaxID=2750080 RepID=A0A9D6LNK9_9BACT|nr:50S ribosomal protein L35 [Candidatus Sungbacteria bacterium]